VNKGKGLIEEGGKQTPEARKPNDFLTKKQESNLQK